jgi:hypothetical protein
MVLVAIMCLATSTNAQAQLKSPRYYGSYYCGDCAIADTSSALGEIYIFLRSTKITDQWVPGDTVTVCDGIYCLQMTWRGSVWAPLGPATKDPHTGYKNDVSFYRKDGSEQYDFLVEWISPEGPLKKGYVIVSDPVPLGAGDGGQESIGKFEPGGDNLDGDPLSTAGC